MNKHIVRAASLLVLLGVLLCCFACGPKNNGGNETQPTVNTNDTDRALAFEKENYKKDFNVLFYETSLYKNFFFDDITEAGDVIERALLERKLLVEDYLGVNVKGTTEGSATGVIQTALARDAMAGEDTYQLALTHGYLGLTALVTEGSVLDLYEFEDISFDEEYYNLEVIDNLEIGGKAYFGSSDYMISDVCAVFFNKDMCDTYQINEDLYALVKNGDWTLEKFKQLCSNVAVNTGDPAWDKEDTYGLGVRADWEFIPLVDACEISWLTGSGYKTLNMGPNNQKYQALYEWCESVFDAEWSYMYNWGDNDNKVTIEDGRFLFTMEAVKYSSTYLASGVKFGMLPYPKFDVDQQEYYSLDAGGMFCVPVTVTDKAMVGKVIECLSFYSAETVNVAYYERLLGTRVAEAPEDAEMLSDYIFGNIISNPAYNFSEKATLPLGVLVYTIPKMLRAKINGDTVHTITTNWAANRIAAQAVIDSTINR